MGTSLRVRRHDIVRGMAPGQGGGLTCISANVAAAALAAASAADVMSVTVDFSLSSAAVTASSTVASSSCRVALASLVASARRVSTPSSKARVESVRLLTMPVTMPVRASVVVVPIVAAAVRRSPISCCSAWHCCNTSNTLTASSLRRTNLMSF